MADELDELPGETDQKVAPPKTPRQPVEPEPDAKKHTHTQRLIGIATELGFTQHDLDNYPSEAIWEEIHNIQKAQAAEAARVQRPVAAQITKTEPEVDAEDEYLAAMEKNPEVDPAFTKFLRKLKEKAEAKDVREKLSKVDKLEEAEKQRANRAANEAADLAFELLGKKFEPLVGTDSMLELTDPGQKGWRTAIYKEAGINHATDSQRVINAKIAKAAAKLAAGKVAEEEEEVAANAYETPKKKPAKDPTSGRFTADQFEQGKIAKPSGKRPGAEPGNAVEQARELFRVNGDPRGYRPAIDDTMDDLPGD